MAWVKLDDRFFTNPKAIAAGPLGCQLFIAGLAYCAAHLTDGWIPDGAMRIVAAQAQVSARIADRLVEVGFWVREDGGYRVHNYLEWNPSRDEAREASLKARAAAHARWNARRNASGNASGMRDALQDAMPSRPVPSKSTSRAAARGEPFAEEFAVVWDDYPRKLNRKGAFAKYQATRRKGASADDLHRAVKNYAIEVRGKEPEFIMHGSTFFGPQERWRDYVDGVPVEGRNAQERALGWDPSELRR